MIIGKSIDWMMMMMMKSGLEAGQARQTVTTDNYRLNAHDYWACLYTESK